MEDVEGEEDKDDEAVNVDEADGDASANSVLVVEGELDELVTLLSRGMDIHG